MKCLVNAITGYCSSLSHDDVRTVGGRLGRLIGSVVRFRRREVLTTIQRCFPEKNEAEVTAIADGMYRHFGTFLVESCRFDRLDRDFLDRYVEIVGLDHAKAAIARGRGVIVLTAHVGNFELLCLLTSVLQHPLTVITKHIRPQALNDYWMNTRTRFGVKMVPTKNSFRACMKALMRKELLGFVLDQNMRRTRGVFVDFFGRPACTSPGLALLSAQCGSPVLPVFITRRPDGGHRVEAWPVLEPPANKEPETIRQATQAYTALIEQAVRAHPDQWIWLHRRWRTQPLPGETASVSMPGTDESLS